MRRPVLLFTSMALALLLASGVAFAATFRGTDDNDDIRGTQASDQIFGLGGTTTFSAWAVTTFWGAARATT